MRKIKSSPRQVTAFKIMLERLSKHEPVTLRSVMREAGYADATCVNPQKNLTSKPGWEALKRELDAGGAKNAFNELVAPTNEDKRTRLAAAIEIMKIVSPDKQTNVIGLFEKIGNDFNASEEN